MRQPDRREPQTKHVLLGLIAVDLYQSHSTQELVSQGIFVIIVPCITSLFHSLSPQTIESIVSFFCTTGCDPDGNQADSLNHGFTSSFVINTRNRRVVALSTGLNPKPVTTVHGDSLRSFIYYSCLRTTLF